MGTVKFNGENKMISGKTVLKKKINLFSKANLASGRRAQLLSIYCSCRGLELGHLRCLINHLPLQLQRHTHINKKQNKYFLKTNPS